ncbi:hypothetical protein J001_06824 [Cryptococcus neoformans]|nr:hypothetical protein J001_06824 [Cryptococcus neoformans var. grubii]
MYRLSSPFHSRRQRLCFTTGSALRSALLDSEVTLRLEIDTNRIPRGRVEAV